MNKVATAEQMNPTEYAAFCPSEAVSNPEVKGTRRRKAKRT